MLPHGGTSKIMLSKRKQTQKATCFMIPFTLNIQHRPSHRDGEQITGYQELGWGCGSEGSGE